MRYLIIGLGIYGSNLAIDLTRMGHEVIGADSDPAIVESIKDSISTAYILDSLDEASLSMLPLLNVDLVIVAIGENFGASVRTVAMLKKAGVPHIYARAVDPLHYSILEGFHVDRIITPEQRAARDLVWEMSLGTQVESMQVADDTYVLRFGAPAFFNGMRYSDIDFEHDYGLRLVSVSRYVDMTNDLSMAIRKARIIPPESYATTKVAGGDVLTLVGTLKAYRSLCRMVSS